MWHPIWYWERYPILANPNRTFGKLTKQLSMGCMYVCTSSNVHILNFNKQLEGKKKVFTLQKKKKKVFMRNVFIIQYEKCLDSSWHVWQNTIIACAN